MNKLWFFTIVSLAVLAGQNAALFLPPLLVEIAGDLEISVPVAGQLATATFAAWAVSVASVGPLSDSFGRRPVMLAGLLVLCVSVIGSAFAPNLEVLLVLRVATGLGGGMLPPNAVATLAEVISPERRAQAVGGLMSVNVLAAAISVPVIALLADWGGWRFAFLIAGLMLALGLLTNWFWFPADNKERVRDFAFLSRFRSLMALPYFQIATVVNATHRMAFWGMVGFFAAYLIATYEVSLGYVALPLTVAAVGQVTGSYSSALVVRSRHRFELLALASVVGGVLGLLFFAVKLDLWAAVAVVTVGSGLLSVGFPTLVAISTEYSGRSTATGVGLMGLSNQGGGVMGAALAGLLLANFGFESIGYMCLGVTIVSGLTAVMFGRYGSPERD